MPITIDLKGRRVLVVGASSGVGRSTALAVSEGGGRVAVVGRRAVELDEVIAKAGDGLALPADLRDAAECRRVVAEAYEGLGGLDAVLFPIGYSPLEFLRTSTTQTWANTFATNVAAPSLVTGAAVDALGEQSALFLYVSSMNVSHPVHALGVYGASKAALDHTIRTWRLEHPEHRFTRLSLGATMPTDIYRDYADDVLNAALPKWASSGLVASEMMHVDEVGAAIADVVAVALAHPTISVDDLTFTPASPPMSTDALAELGTQAGRSERVGGDEGAVGV